MRDKGNITRLQGWQHPREHSRRAGGGLFHCLTGSLTANHCRVVRRGVIGQWIAGDHKATVVTRRKRHMRLGRVTQCPGRCGGASGDAESGAGVGYVPVYRVRAEVKPLGDLAIGKAIGDEI